MKRFNWTKVLPLVAAVPLLMVSDVAYAQEAAAADPRGTIALAAGLAMGIAAIGGTLGQGLTARAALEGIARNPQAASSIQTPMIIGLALIESLVVITFVMAFLLQGHI